MTAPETMFCHRLSNVDLSLTSLNVKFSTSVKGQDYVDSKSKAPFLCFSRQEVKKSLPPTQVHAS